jgi:hypothetical protein
MEWKGIQMADIFEQQVDKKQKFYCFLKLVPQKNCTLKTIMTWAVVAGGKVPGGHQC